jgi:hypothetical protein
VSHVSQIITPFVRGCWSKQAYPWALLVFWQLLMPGVSFWGHLGGLIAGEAYVRGWLKALVPNQRIFGVRPTLLLFTDDVSAVQTLHWCRCCLSVLQPFISVSLL